MQGPEDVKDAVMEAEPTPSEGTIQTQVNRHPGWARVRPSLGLEGWGLSGVPGLRSLLPSLLEAQSMLVANRAGTPAASVLIPVSFITQGSLGCLR